MKWNKGRYALATAAGLGVSLLAHAGLVTVETADVTRGSVVIGTKGTSLEVAPGKTTTLKATPVKGFAFAGWYVDGEPAELPVDYRTPSVTVTATEENLTFTARFVAPDEDCLWFDGGDLEYLMPNEEVDFNWLTIDSGSFPTLSVSGLPKGLSFDAKTLTLKGRPTVPGQYQVTITGKNASGYQYSQIITTVVDNIWSDRIEGSDIEASVGETLTFDIADFFSYDDTDLKALSITGWPKGVSYSAATGEVKVAPTTPGVFTVTAKATYLTDAEGNVRTTDETATLLFTVYDVDPYEYEVDLFDLEELEVGAALPAEGFWIGGYDAVSKTGITKVSGLPAGLVAEKVVEGEETYYVVKGVPTKAGLAKVSVTVGVPDATGRVKSVTVSKTVIVRASESYYVAVATVSGAGTVSGSGVVQPGTKITLKATPAKGSVFAGWEDVDGNPIDCGDVDYRTPSLSVIAGIVEDMPILWGARFVTDLEDAAAIEIGELEDQDYDFSPETWDDIVFPVETLSLAKVTSKGLPTGFSIVNDATDPDLYAIVYDDKDGKNVPYPGFYPCTVTVETASKAKKTVAFSITVANWTSEAISVPDDFGEFIPGEPIEPIDLVDAVDFEAGDTLTVSGLPKGLVFNAKADPKKGVDANTISGTPTVPGVYTVKFVAKIVASATTNKTGKVTYVYATEQATSTLMVLDFPLMSVFVDEESAAAGCKVSGAGNYIQGTKVTLKATAGAGYVFAGWTGLPETLSVLETLNPTLTRVTGPDDLEIVASFVPLAEDDLFVAPADEIVLPLKENITEEDILFDLIESVSLPTASVSGLPKGLKFDAKTMKLSGAPTVSGVYPVTISAKNAGGYSYVRVVTMIVANADGTLPEAPIEPDAAELGLEDLDALEVTTGVVYDSEAYDIVFTAYPEADTESEVTAVKVSEVPAGLVATTVLEDGEATILLGGVPTKPGLAKLTVEVTYANKHKAKSTKTFIVYDGGSSYIAAETSDPSMGTVTGAGVYAAGQTVKLTAKPSGKNVFTGWFADEEACWMFNDLYGIDYRSATVSFVCVRDLLPFDGFVGTFATAADDAAPQILFDGDDEEAGDVEAWEILDLNEDDEIGFTILSGSLPKLTVKGLPKGVSVDPVVGLIAYDSSAKAAIVPGIYTVMLTAVNTSKLSVTRTIEIHVPNKTSDIISSDPDMEAYPLTVGAAIGDIFDGVELLEDDYTLSVSGLPAGLTFANGRISGVATKAGDYTVTLTAKRKGAPDEIATITVRVAPMPEELVGTFNGCAFFGDGDSLYEPNGPLTLTVAASGQITAKLVLPHKTVSFKAACWDEIADEYAFCEMMSGEMMLSLEVSRNLADGTYEVEGFFVDPDARFHQELSVRAQRDVYKLTDASSVAVQDGLKRLLGSEKQKIYKFVSDGDGYVLIPSGTAGLTLTVKNTGAATLSGSITFSGKAVKVSATGVVYCVDGSYFVELAAPVNKEYEAVFTYFLDTIQGDLGVYEADCAQCVPD